MTRYTIGQLPSGALIELAATVIDGEIGAGRVGRVDQARVARRNDPGGQLDYFASATAASAAITARTHVAPLSDDCWAK